MAEFASYYYLVYWFVVMLMTVSKFNTMRRWPSYAVIQKRDDYQPLVLFSVFYILFFGLRPVVNDGTFGDTGPYANKYELLQNYGVFDMQGSEDVGSDWIFGTLMRSCAQVMDVHFFFTIVMFFYIVMMFAGCRKLDNCHGATLMLFCIGAFEFYPFSVNGIRNGMACSFLIFALALLNKGNKLWPIILSFIAIGCHKSTALPVACMFFTYFVRKPKLMYIAWFGAIVISLAVGNYIDNMLSLLNFDDRLADNLQNDSADGQLLEHRFRWDFLLFSSMPILLGAYTLFKRRLYDKTYLLLLGTYMYANSFWVLAIRGIFSNRIAYLSWFLYPIVLAYPLLTLPVFKKNHSQKTAWILLGHFGFTTVLLLIAS